MFPYLVSLEYPTYKFFLPLSSIHNVTQFWLSESMFFGNGIGTVEEESCSKIRMLVNFSSCVTLFNLNNPEFDITSDLCVTVVR